MFDPKTLPPREHDVLVASAEGLTAKTTARRLGISPHTVRVYRDNAMRRLGAVTITQAVVIALNSGALTLGPR